MDQEQTNSNSPLLTSTSSNSTQLSSPLSVELNLQDYFFAASLIDGLSEVEAVNEIDRVEVGKIELDKIGLDTVSEAEKTSALKTDRPTAPILPEMWETWFQQWLQQLQADLPPSKAYELSLRLTDDAEIHALNAQYRHKNQPTDVLAFAALEVDCPQPNGTQLDELLDELQPDGDNEDWPLYLGDIVISVETAQKQAVQFGHSLTQELAWLAAHALLHLLGWDHPDDDSLNCMLEQQAFLLQTVGLSIDYYQVEKSTGQEYSDTEPCKV